MLQGLTARTARLLGALLGVLLGVVSAGIALGEAFVFAAPGGAGLRASLYLVLGALLAIDPWASAPRARGVPLAAAQRQLALGHAAVLVASLVLGLALGPGSPRPAFLAATGAACCGWAGSQVALASDAWRNSRGAPWPRCLALAPSLLAALGASCAVARGASDGFWRAPWPAVLGLGLGLTAAGCLRCLVRRHAEAVLAP